MGHQIQIRYRNGSEDYLDTDLFTDAQPFRSKSVMSDVAVGWNDLSDGLWVRITCVTPLGQDSPDGDAVDCGLGESYRYQAIDRQDLEELEWVKHNGQTVLFRHGGEIVNGVKLLTLASSYLSDDRLEDIRPIIADVWPILRKEMELGLNGEAAATGEDDLYARAAERMGVPVFVLKETIALYEALDEGDGDGGGYALGGWEAEEGEVG